MAVLSITTLHYSPYRLVVAVDEDDKASAPFTWDVLATYVAAGGSTSAAFYTYLTTAFTNQAAARTKFRQNYDPICSPLTAIGSGAGSGDTLLANQTNYGALAAAGTNYVAQFAAGAPIDSIGPFTNLLPFRVPQIVLGGGGANPVIYTLTGTDFKGLPQTRTITATGPGTYVGDRAFSTITRLQSNVNPGGTTDLQTGPGFGTGWAFADTTVIVGVNGAAEVPTAVNGASGTVIPASAPNGARIFTVQGKLQHSHSYNTVAPQLVIDQNVSAPNVAGNFRLTLTANKAVITDTATWILDVVFRHSVVW